MAGEIEIETLTITTFFMLHFTFEHIEYNICVRVLRPYFMFFIVKTCKNFILLSTLERIIYFQMAHCPEASPDIYIYMRFVKSF